MPETFEQQQPLVTVITVCLNSSKTIQQTLDSVLAQTYPRIEYIIIDGGSTDGTQQILDRYRDRLARVVREKDLGVSDAFNKGIVQATGEYIQIVNADDCLEPDKIERSVALLQEHPQAAYVYGDMKKIDWESGRRKFVAGDPHYAWLIRFIMPRLNHPTVLARKSAYNQHGRFDLKWQIAMDYDWLLRLHQAGEWAVREKGARVLMGCGGLSDVKPIAAFREVRDISIAHGLNRLLAHGCFVARCVKHLLWICLGLRKWYWVLVVDGAASLPLWDIV